MSAHTGIHLTRPHLAASIHRAAVIAAALATTACSSTPRPPNQASWPWLIIPWMWLFIPAVFIAAAVYEAVLRHQRTRALEAGTGVIAAWTCPDEVWIAHTRNKLRTPLRFAGIFALLIGLAAILHVERVIVLGLLDAIAAVFLALCVGSFLVVRLVVRWWPTRFRNVRVVIARDNALVAGRNYTWRRGYQHFTGARIVAGNPRLLVIGWTDNAGSHKWQTHHSLEIPLSPADEATAKRVVRALGELRDDGLIHDEFDDYVASR